MTTKLEAEDAPRRKKGSRAPLDLAGERSGSYVAIAPTGARSHLGIEWLCRCDCGHETRMPAAKFKRANQCASCAQLGNTHGSRPRPDVALRHRREMAARDGVEVLFPVMNIDEELPDAP